MSANVWAQILSRIETKVNRHSFYTWFEPTSFVEDAGGTVTVRVPNPLFRDWLTKHYSAVIDEAIAEVSRQGTLIAFVPPGGEVQVTPHLDAPAARLRPLLGGAHPPPVSIRGTRSAPLSWAHRISSQTQRLERSPKLRRAHITRCSSTAVWGSARLTSCTRSVNTFSSNSRTSGSLTSRRNVS